MFELNKEDLLKELKSMNENEIKTYEKITVTKRIAFVEGGHGLSNLKCTYYKWIVEFGNEDDKDYDYLNYNETEIETCIECILKQKICY